MNDSSRPVSQDDVVSFHYTLKNKAGDVVDSSDGREPLSYLHGHKQIVPGLEKHLTGKTVGDSLDVTVEPEEGYGGRREDLVLSVPRAQSGLPDSATVGQFVELRAGNGERIPARISEINDAAVVIDANHPLAGEQLFFAVAITAVRAATKEELEHGHAHP